MITYPRFLLAGDSALVLEFGDEVSPSINAEIRRLMQRVQRDSAHGVREIVPTYRSLMVHYDPLVIPFRDLRKRLEESLQRSSDVKLPPAKRIEVPTLYGGEWGPDLKDVAATNGLTSEEVVQIHSGMDYLVYMIGFVPGFPYLGEVPDRIRCPRLATPRLKVPAGSVALADRLTGIYPLESPGGWRLIGRTPLNLFSLQEDPPSILSAGDLVRFVPIDQDTFQNLSVKASEEKRRDDLTGKGEEGIRPVLQVVQAGLLTTVQDLGREGYQQYGVPVSGAMDRFAFQIANALVGNPPNDACLEITLYGPTLKALAPTSIAVTGADMVVTCNGEHVGNWRSVKLNVGDILEFQEARQGLRAYLAIAGGINCPQVLGSRSTYLKAGFGGFDGRPLRVGDTIRGESRQCSDMSVPKNRVPSYKSGMTVRVLLGPQDDYFTEAGISTFLSSEYVITSASDRMGYRLSGPLVQHVSKTEIISDGIAWGAVQVPGDGMPIIMMVDRQTTGGYPKIANVISADLPLLAQAQPEDPLRFKQVDVYGAQSALAKYQEELSGITALLEEKLEWSPDYDRIIRQQGSLR